MEPGYDYHVVGTIHNFGVFKNSGKKVILQIDFKTNKVNLIKRGTIQYKCDFDDLSYDSEEGVLFCIKIGGKQTELTAENLEEKTAICRLLSIVQSTAVDLVKREDRINSLDKAEDLVVRTRASSVLKEGVLEKKGNATIQIWAKRKVKVTPGMFSYFKTDEQGEGNSKNDEAMKDSANQTNFGEKLSDIVSTSVTKGRPKLSSGEKQPLVAVKSLITEENEEEVEMRDGKRIEDEDALQLKNPLYDVVKDLRYSSSEDNMSSGHEEMVCPEGDYAYPEDVFENQHEEGNRKSDAGCPTYDEIGDQIVPSEENRDQDKEENTMEHALYSTVNPKTNTHDSGNKKQSFTPRKETPIYSVSVKRRKSKRELQQQRGSLPAPPPPPPLSLISPLALPSVQISGSLSENTDGVKFSRKKSLDRPNSHPPPPPISEDRRSVSSASTKSVVPDTTEQQESHVEGSPNVFLSPSDRRSASSFSSELSHSSAGKSGVLSDDEQGQFSEKNVSESSRERLSSTQSSESSKSDTLITNTEQEYSKSDAGSLITLVHQLTIVSDEKVDLLNSHEHPPPATESESSNSIKQNDDKPEIESKEECPTKEDHIVTSLYSDTEKTDLHHDADLSRMGSSKLNLPAHNLPQWPPVSEVKSSFWKHASDRKNDINKDLIMEHFSIVEENQPTKTAEQTFAGTKLLLDATRARNLGIILTGLKAEGARHIREVINSVTEDEFFPAEKLTTIRRYQPTSDDIELFKLYSDKKSTLDPVDRFMCELCEIEYIGTRLDLILLLWDFPRQLRCTHEFMDMRGKTTDFTFSHFLVVMLEEKDPEIIKWTGTMDSVIRCKDINIKALVTEHKLVEFENSMNSLEKESTNIQTTYRHLLEYFGEVSSLPSNELFSVLSDFALKFRKATEDIDRKKRYQTLRHF
uniref:Formin-like protein 11 n=1 Tax=Magallana gigas TaxID=29159 RepID=K1Q8Z1_MAGGI